MPFSLIYYSLYPVKVMLVDLYVVIRDVWDVFRVLLILGRTFMFGSSYKKPKNFFVKT